MIGACLTNLKGTEMKNKSTSWLAVTTYKQRFKEAVTLLCNGKEPPDYMVDLWLDQDSDDLSLQEFAIEHGPSWCQGIVLLDAASMVANYPSNLAEQLSVASGVTP